MMQIYQPKTLRYTLLRKIFLIVSFLSGLYTALFAQNNNPAKLNEMPKLVVGIVVDQMRNDYLYRFYDKFGEGGFKRLMQQGFICRNTHYNYVPTETAPGHASVYTGTTPAYHGIVANDWFENSKTLYCVADSTVKTVGSETGNGYMSPRNLLTTTITDQLKLASNQKSKIIGISIKDRGAILPSGHTANAAYWYDKLNGKFISSTYYMQNLPLWVDKFNARKLADKYLSMTWNTLLPIANYTESDKDDNEYESLLGGKTKPVFPYNLKEMSAALVKSPYMKSAYDLLTYTPFGNTLVKEMVLTALTEEKMGKGQFADFLAISFSSTDLVGHAFGPRSIEIEDTYLRLDKDLEELLENLDKEIGEGNYLLFLTADHAVTDIPKYLTNLKIPSGYIRMKDCISNLKTYLDKIYEPNLWVLEADDKQVYLNHKLIKEKKIDLEEIQETAAQYLLTCEGVFDTYTASQLKEENYTEGIRAFAQKGFYHQRSGDITIMSKSGWLANTWEKGTSHGTSYNYDTHVPLLWYGWNIPKGENTVKYIQITDITPTLALLLNIQIPNSATGRVIEDVFKK